MYESQRRYRNEHREEYRTYCRIANKRHYDKKRAIVDLAKKRPCADCGQQLQPCQMDLDHVRGEKLINIGQSLKAGSIQALLQEIEKCDVVCANCHRLRTWNRSHISSILTSET